MYVLMIGMLSILPSLDHRPMAYGTFPTEAACLSAAKAAKSEPTKDKNDLLVAVCVPQKE